jgi:hypothetical protein
MLDRTQAEFLPGMRRERGRPALAGVPPGHRDAAGGQVARARVRARPGCADPRVPAARLVGGPCAGGGFRPCRPDEFGSYVDLGRYAYWLDNGDASLDGNEPVAREPG